MKNHKTSFGALSEANDNLLEEQSPRRLKGKGKVLDDVCGSTSSSDLGSSTSDASDVQKDAGSQHSAMSAKIGEYKHPARMAFFIFVAMSAQTFRGFQPGFRRYLQLTANFQALELASFRNGLVATFLAPWVFYRLGFGVFRLKNAWVLFLTWVPAQIATFYSAQLTYSYYLRLIDMSTPFWVALVSRGYLKKPMPPYTIPAMVVSTIGGVTSLSGQIFNSDVPQFLADDLAGMLLGVLSSFCIACGLVYYQTVNSDFPTEAILFLQNLFVVMVTLPLSLGLEDNWVTTWQNLTTQDEIMIACQMVAYISGLWLQIIAVRNLGAPLVSTVIAWGFVVALVFGTSPLLNEKVNTLNIIGAVIMSVAVTTYLVYQYILSRRVETAEKVDVGSDHDDSDSRAPLKRASQDSRDYISISNR